MSGMTMTMQTPRWQDLFSKLLSQDHPEPASSEVELYQAQPALGIDLELAWQETMLPATLLAEVAPRIQDKSPAVWTAAGRLSFAAPFPCCTGMAPQFLKNIEVLFDDVQGFFKRKPVIPSGTFAEPTLDNKSTLSQLAIARIAGDVEQVNRLLAMLDGEQVQKNEQAAQLWLNGKQSEARELWNQLDGNHPVVAFNQGLAALAAGEQRLGRQSLTKAVHGFKESTGWHHLAELYLMLAQ